MFEIYRIVSRTLDFTAHVPRNHPIDSMAPTRNQPQPLNRTTSLIWNDRRKNRTRRRLRRKQGEALAFGQARRRVHCPLQSRPSPPIAAQLPRSRRGDHLRPRPWGWVRWTQGAGEGLRGRLRVGNPRACGTGDGRRKGGESAAMCFVSR